MAGPEDGEGCPAEAEGKCAAPMNPAPEVANLPHEQADSGTCNDCACLIKLAKERREREGGREREKKRGGERASTEFISQRNQGNAPPPSVFILPNRDGVCLLSVQQAQSHRLGCLTAP